MIQVLLLLTQDTQKLSKQLLGTKIDIRVGGQKQEGSIDCGLFVIATCVSLAAGGQPHRFIQEKCMTICCNALKT